MATFTKNALQNTLQGIFAERTKIVIGKIAELKHQLAQYFFDFIATEVNDQDVALRVRGLFHGRHCLFNSIVDGNAYDNKSYVRDFSYFCTIDRKGTYDACMSRLRSEAMKMGGDVVGIVVLNTPDRHSTIYRMLADVYRYKS